MPFNLQLQHLTMLALNPGFKSYAWVRAKELEAASDLFKGLPEALRNAVTGPAKASGFGPQNVTKPLFPGRKSGS